MNIPVELIGLNGNEGWVLAEPILNQAGQVLCPVDKELDVATVTLLKKHYEKNKELTKDIIINIKFNTETMTDEQKVYAEALKEQNCDVIDTVPAKLRNSILLSLKKVYNPSLQKVHEALSVVDMCIEEMAKNIQLSQDFSYSLGQYKDSKSAQSIYNHSLRVAEFAVTLAKIYNSELTSVDDYIDLKAVGTVALLHDFGVSFQNEEMMSKIENQQLSESFKAAYPTIPEDILYRPYSETYKNLYAFVYLKSQLESSTLSSLLLCGESENGKGNCLHIGNSKNNKSSIIAKIVFICNLYDSLLTTIIKKQDSLENVSTTLETLIENGVVNKELGTLLLNNIPLYSVGVRVKLSTGEYATVVERFKGRNASKPIVKTLVNPPLQSKTYDLRELTNITITQIIESHATLDQTIKEFTQNQLKSIGIVSMQDYIEKYEIEENNNVISM